MDAMKQWAARGLEACTSAGKRIFEHIAILACAVAVGIVSGSFPAGIYTYVGGVCITGRGMAASPCRLLPAAAGVLQTAILALAGLPVPQALFWGGAQSWLQRLLQKRLQMGAEWGLLLFLLPIGIHLVEQTPLLLLVCSFAGIAVVGGILTWLDFRRQALAARIAELQKQGPPEPERVAAYRASLAEFNGKIGTLPEKARTVAASIALSTDRILHSMATDTRDLEPGHRFLNRYFKAAHAVVDQHVKLARVSVLSPEIREALSQSEETLKRLDVVFAKERARLLENDASDFSADLAVIDTLLKMDGR